MGVIKKFDTFLTFCFNFLFREEFFLSKMSSSTCFNFYIAIFSQDYNFLLLSSVRMFSLGKSCHIRNGFSDRYSNLKFCCYIRSTTICATLLQIIVLRGVLLVVFLDRFDKKKYRQFVVSLGVTTTTAKKY